MMKYKPLALAIALLSTVSMGSARAAESVAGGLELSGYVDIVTGWQHDDTATSDFGSCSFGIGGLGCNSVDGAGSGYGELGNFRGLGTPNRDTFNFYIDAIELDLQKSFGENIRLRADLRFGRFLSGTPNAGGANFILEQGYVTINIPVGNGAELLVGRFNVPMGYESVDRPNNTAISFSNIFRYVRPQNTTGAKIYYAFNNLFDWSIYVVNNLSDTFSFAIGTDSAIPSWGTRFGFTFGEEGRQSTVGLSYAGGPENWGHNAHLTHILDLDFMIRITDIFRLGGEAIYRQDNTGFVTPAGVSFLGIPNSKVLAGNLLFDFNPSQSWEFWFRYGYIHDINPTGAYTGLDQQIHDLTLGAGYQITDNAVFKFEFRTDVRHYSAASAAAAAPITGASGGRTSLSYGLAGEFAYQF